jgi:hypothetical protein
VQKSDVIGSAFNPDKLFLTYLDLLKCKIKEVINVKLYL